MAQTDQTDSEQTRPEHTGPEPSHNEDSDAKDRGRRNLIEFNRAVTRWCSRGTLDERDGIVLCASGSWIPMMGNSAFRTDDAVPGPELVARAASFFGAMGRGFCVKVRDSGEDEDLRAACVDAGMEPYGPAVPEMVCRSPLPDAPVVDGVEPHAVGDEAAVRDFLSVNAEAYGTYGLPPEAMDDLFDRPVALLDDPSAHLVVARRGSEPLAAAMVFESDGVASVQWVGTVSAARRLGLGALVTSWVTNVAFDHHASSCTLQASPMGEPVYVRLGYETLFRFTEFVRWPPGPSQ
jgi:hypothetical protein